MKSLPISKVKAEISRIFDIVERQHKVITITRRGKPVAVILSKSQYDGWKETNAITQDREFMNEIRDGIKAMRRTKKRYSLEKLFGS